MKKILRFKFEIIITLLYIILFYYSLKLVGINTFITFIYNLLFLISIQFIYFGIKIIKKMLKDIL